MNFLNEHLTRQADLLPTELLGKKITIVGAGAIGSFTALNLAKMGFQDLTVIDFDKIETVNMNSQFYRFSDIGKFKAEALKDLVRDFTNVEIEAKTERYTGGIFNGIVISAVDSMAVRRLIWENHKEVAVGTDLVIDGRMAIEHALVYAMSPMSTKDIESYEKTLYSDDAAVQERCTNKATVFTACLISGFIAKIVKDFVVKGNYARVTNWSIAGNKLESFPLKKGLIEGQGLEA